MAALLTVETGDNIRSMVSGTVAAMSNEAALVARARGGDTRAFEVLYREHVDRVYGLCLRMVADPSQAEDLTQEAFTRAFRSWDKVGLMDRPDAWVHRPRGMRQLRPLP